MRASKWLVFCLEIHGQGPKCEDGRGTTGTPLQCLEMLRLVGIYHPLGLQTNVKDEYMPGSSEKKWQMYVRVLLCTFQRYVNMHTGVANPKHT
jgi:hypothetical protein